MQLIWCLLSNFYLYMFRASLCPSSGEQECALPHMVFCTLRLSRTVTFTVHTACVPAPHNHSHHCQCGTPYAAVHTIVLLMMGIMMPETCWDKFDNKHQISCILLVSLSSPCGIILRTTSPPLLSDHLRFTFDRHPHKGLYITFTVQKVPTKRIKLEQK